MNTFVERKKELSVRNYLKEFPCVALLGSRQVGKSTLAKKIIKEDSTSLYLDLEDPRDNAKLQDPSSFLEANKDRLICIDEIQRKPELFQILRGYIDRNNRNGQLLLLGSASRDLIQQSSETLAGRIAYLEISPFLGCEVKDHKKLWLQGGYPNSFQKKEHMSFEWRIQYIRSFLERDLPNLGFNIPPEALRRFWQMLAHSNGSLLNASKLAASMGVSAPTIKSYIDILEGTFVIKQLKPFHSNTKKRLVKSPKIYIKDTGLLHCLLGIESYNDLLGHPIKGSSFESLVITSLLEKFPRHEASFYRNLNGSEIDLVFQKSQKTIAFEIKASTTPKLTQGFFEGLKVTKAQKAYVIADINTPFPIHENIWAHSLESILKEEI